MKLRSIDTRGQGNALTVIIAVLAVGVVAMLLFGVPQRTGGGGGTVSCEIEPYIDNATFNEYARGTSVGVTYSYIVDGESMQARTLTTGSSGTTFKVGDKLKVFSTASGYLDQLDDLEITSCGSNKFTNYVKATDGGTVDILDQNFNAVSDSATGGATNITGSANPINFVLRFDGVVDESTGQLYVTVEGNDTEIDDMVISLKSGQGGVVDGDAPILDLFTAEGTAPTIKKAFIIEEILDGAQVDYNVRVTPESGKTLGAGATSGFIYVNAYQGQWFIDRDGSFQYGWEDSQGTAKHEGAFTDHDALIKA